MSYPMNMITKVQFGLFGYSYVWQTKDPLGYTVTFREHMSSLEFKTFWKQYQQYHAYQGA